MNAHTTLEALTAAASLAGLAVAGVILRRSSAAESPDLIWRRGYGRGLADGRASH